MQTINLYRKSANNLEMLPLDNRIYNTEAKMYRFNYLGQDYILKSLHNTSGDIFANKLYTIEMLDTNKYSLPRNFCIPKHLVSVDKRVVGFSLPLIEGENFINIINNPNIKEEEKLYFYKKIGDVLDQLKNIRKYTSLKGVYINDLHEANIMVNQNNREIFLVDLDSCKIGKNCAFPSKYLNSNELLNNKPFKYRYNKDENGPGYISANENSDIYCYVIMLLNYLLNDNMFKISEEEFLEFLDYLTRIGFNKELLDCLYLITKDNKDNKNPRDYLDTVTPKQIVKARKFYTLTK